MGRPRMANGLSVKEVRMRSMALSLSASVSSARKAATASAASTGGGEGSVEGVLVDDVEAVESVGSCDVGEGSDGGGVEAVVAGGLEGLRVIVMRLPDMAVVTLTANDSTAMRTSEREWRPCLTLLNAADDSSSTL